MKWLGTLIRWTITISLLSLAFTQVPFSDWYPQLKNLDFFWSSIAALSMVAIVLTNAWKWKILLKVQGYTPNYRRVLYHYAVGYFFNSFITGTGDIKRATDMGKELGDMPRAIASVLAERWTGVIGQIGLAACTVSILLCHTTSVWPMVLTAIILMLALVLIYLWFENAHNSTVAIAKERLWQTWIQRLRLAMSVYKGHRHTWWICLGLSFVGPILLVVIHIALAYALGYSPSPYSMLLLIPTISVFAQLPITINGFGLQDYCMVVLFKGTLLPEQALALSMVFHALRLTIGASGGLLFALAPQNK